MQSRRHNARQRLIATMAVAAAAVGLISAQSAATGAPAPSTSRGFPINNCFGLSPNIVDVPYAPSQVVVGQYDGWTNVMVTYGSLWLLTGYDSVARFDWRHLDNGKRGTFVSNSNVRPPNTGVHGFTWPRNQPGKGRVEVTLSTVNRNALWEIPATTCKGTIVIS
ncbi:hypothetical protein [Gordonia soli]|uniref:Uncharacterized protein n=1 Tax=Gordonia soli NBRC 108243 TaxID=1223545 RepID=M0QHG4_9ACTN|nr:hypothetical protein [Gordonia soli]GAC66847.1 hypothetical protein GS4_05_00560 [Gordonia soli NBRC 108243]